MKKELGRILLAIGICPSLAWGATVHELCDAGSPSRRPFPANRFTVADDSQITGLRVNLPKPDCSARPTDCEEVDVINTLDGFSVQPRLSIPFDGPINVQTVTSDTVYLLTLTARFIPRRKIGITRIVWDPATLTLFAEPDDLLEQHALYSIVVTSGVKDADGNPVVPSSNCATAFTTRSVTATLEQIRAQIKARQPDRADFLLGPGGGRTVFPFGQLQTITFTQQTAVNPSQFTASAIVLDPLNLIPGVIGQVAFGRYRSPEYLIHPGEFIPSVGTRTGTPKVQAMNDVY